MIRYSLTCKEGHRFDSWFQTADAFDRLTARNLVACSHCGTSEVTKALMAPAVRSDSPALTTPREETDIETRLAALRRQVEENADYVGLSFAAEARAMHDGDRPERAIYGEARPDEARALIEDGIPVAPLPFMPRRNTN
jgi:hypothetical protein